jgi:hypothetical protein
MKPLRILLLALLAGGTALALVVSLLGLGVPRADARGVSLREESARSGGMFFSGYRSHRGGGIADGK